MKKRPFLKSSMLKTLAAFAASTTAALSFYATPAQACGGLFCNNNSPVVQSAEKLIFVHDEDTDAMTMVVEIQYAGESEDFSWLLPVPGVPDISVSSQLAMNRLSQFTQPTFRLDREVLGDCKQPEYRGDVAYDAAPESAQGGAADGDLDNDGNAVTVLDSGSVGPYDFVVIQIDQSADDVADVAVEWLVENDYDVNDSQKDIIRPYLLEHGLNLVAVKLSSGESSGSVAPLRLDMSSPCPFIPIKLTAIAAQNNMGIEVYVAADNRAVPINYNALELNEARLNWMQLWGPGGQPSNYRDVINEAADEAGGHGFITEKASASSEVVGNISKAARDNLDSIRQQFQDNEWSDKFFLMQNLARTYASEPGLIDALEEAGASDELVEAFRMQTNLDRETVNNDPVDTDELFRQLDQKVIKPIEDLEILIGTEPYLTRLFTTLSPSEMNLDPMFDYTQELEDHDNNRVAKQFIFCTPDIFIGEAPYRIDFENGTSIRGEGGAYPQIGEDMPFNASVDSFDESGQRTNERDNLPTIITELETQNRDIELVSREGRDSGCSNTASQSVLGLMLMGLYTLNRRTLRRRK